MRSILTVRFAFRAVLLVSALFVFNRCSDECHDNAEYIFYEPVYSTFDELRMTVTATDPKPISRTGKIYWKDNYLYINEPGRGIHVIDNADPSHPAPVSFIAIPGNVDLAIRDNILYADSYMDLVAISIGNPGYEQEVSREKDVFALNTFAGFIADPQRGVVTDWKKSTTTRLTSNDCSYQYSVYGMMAEDGILVRRGAEASFMSAASSSSGGSTTGVAGSFARFAITGDYLYALTGSRLEVFNIPHPASISKKEGVEVGWDVETIFPLGQTLFLGSQSGMHIMDIQTPDAPKKISTFAHIRSCDPVVVEDGFAYVTLRNGSQCGGFTNQLEVIDISDLTNPALVKIYPMTNPHGVGIDNGILFVCDGASGLKVFDATNREEIDANQLAHYRDVQAFDIIPLNNVAMVIGETGLYQYDYSNVRNIRLLSHLPITKQP